MKAASVSTIAFYMIASLVFPFLAILCGGLNRSCVADHPPRPTEQKGAKTFQQKAAKVTKSLGSKHLCVLLCVLLCPIENSEEPVFSATLRIDSFDEFNRLVRSLC
jgi:hypothetical protein